MVSKKIFISSWVMSSSSLRLQNKSFRGSKIGYYSNCERNRVVPKIPLLLFFSE